MSTPAERLSLIQNRIKEACLHSNRNTEEVTLIAVSKTQPVEAIQALYDLGVRNFGESKAQELATKAVQLPNDIVWHFIGPLQSNKVRKVAEFAKVIHSIDSESQLREIKKLTHSIGVLVEINVANEAQKSGICLKSLDQFLEKLLQCEQVNFLGLMTIGPVREEAEQMRPYFAEMRNANRGDWLSMGMSSDFEVAIQEGSTHIRVGTALFGDRTQS